MDIMFNIPYIIRVLISLFSILVINKILKKLWLSVLIGTIVLILWVGHSWQTIWLISSQRAFSVNNLLLLFVVLQVIWLSLQMSATGTMRSMVDYIRTRTSQRFSMAVLPAVIGLLPMPGGAIFSAPLVDDCDPEKKLAPLLKTKINFWFRHIWEYWWPLYPGVLLAIDITGLPIYIFVCLQIPLSFLSVAAGYFFLLRKVKYSDEHKKSGQHFSWGTFISLIMPVLIVIIVYILIKIFFPAISALSKYMPMIIGIFLAQVFLQARKPLPLIEWKKILFSKKNLVLLIMVLLIRIYGAFIEGTLPDGTFLMTHMRDELNAWGFPVIFVVMLLPFISGMTTGLAIGFVGASFPVVMSLLGTDPGLNVLLSTTILAYAFGYMGMLLSPVHICLIVTNEYFKTRLMDSIIRLLKPASIVFIGSLIFYYIIRHIF